MAGKIFEYWGGPYCGQKKELQTAFPPGWATDFVGQYYYVSDGGRRLVWTQTRKGTTIIALMKERQARQQRGFE